jgi:YebC/PmpR family DNA-binding regulatory protein
MPMSGHSKWSQIKRQKGINDLKKGNVFTKMALAITIIAKQSGNGDPDTNPRLRMAIEEARSANMPKENIQRAIDKGLGKLPGQTIEEVRYEGFGPNRVAFLVDGITDNKLRTTSEIRNIFEKNGGLMASTAYMFDKVGEIRVKGKQSLPSGEGKGGKVEDEELELMDTGAEDIEEFSDEGNQLYLLTTTPNSLNEVSTKVTQLGFEIEAAELIMRPNMSVEINDQQTLQKVLDFAEKLEDHDDIQKVYSNLEIPETLI